MLERYLVISIALFCTGMFGVLSRRNIVGVLISIELMLNAVNVALVAFSRYVSPAALRMPGADTSAPWVLSGQTFAAFVIVVAAAEVALGLALLIAVVRHTDTVDVTQVNALRR